MKLRAHWHFIVKNNFQRAAALTRRAQHKGCAD